MSGQFPSQTHLHTRALYVCECMWASFVPCNANKANLLIIEDIMKRGAHSNVHGIVCLVKEGKVYGVCLSSSLGSSIVEGSLLCCVVLDLSIHPSSLTNPAVSCYVLLTFESFSLGGPLCPVQCS